MPTRSPARCTKCRRIHPGRGLCPDCERKVQLRRNKRVDAKRGTASARGYSGEHVTRFRVGVLGKHPFCVCTDSGHGHDGAPCGLPSTHADHWPWGRKELVAMGLDANDPAYGRGLCASCDSRQTALRQPGGWAKKRTA
jgi:5-methylcytosine-specific restriction enzyme A